jgi:hypothetical protein
VARRRNAIVTALFSYGQSTIGMVLGLLVTRAVLGILGKDIWGLWAASGALLAYAGLADLGVLRVLLWHVADADGRKDHDRLRASLSSALPFACLSAVGYVVVAFSLWQFYPELLHLSLRDQSTLRGPVFLVVLLTAATFPLRVFSVLLIGLQDATFLGVLGLVEMALTGFLTFVLAWQGFGLYALAVGTALPPVLSAGAALIRAQLAFRPFVRGWPKPTRALMGSLGRDGIGLWLAGVGFQLAVATDPIILAYCGLREMVSGFVLTSRLPMTLMHLGWILPGAALVGLGQLSAEGSRARSREVVLAILRLHMIISGAVASAVLAANAGFVGLWVGPDLFLGKWLNALVAANVVMMTAVHGLTSISAIFGGRVKVGIVFLANGVLHILFASLLSKPIGVHGVAAATFLSAALTALPVGLRLLEATAGVTVKEVLTEVYWPWLRRFVPLAVLAFAIGRFGLAMPFPLLVIACSAFGLVYLFWMKPLYVGLPLGARLTGWLNKLRLLPPSAT